MRQAVGARRHPAASRRLPRPATAERFCRARPRLGARGISIVAAALAIRCARGRCLYAARCVGPQIASNQSPFQLKASARAVRHRLRPLKWHHRRTSRHAQPEIIGLAGRGRTPTDRAAARDRERAPASPSARVPPPPAEPPRAATPAVPSPAPPGLRATSTLRPRRHRKPKRRRCLHRRHLSWRRRRSHCLLSSRRSRPRRRPVPSASTENRACRVKTMTRPFDA